MLGSVKALLVCGALIAAGLGAAAPAAASAASASDTCTVTIGHINGGTTVTFSGQVECNYSTTSIELHASLYFCGSQQPEANKNWLSANCGDHTNMQTYAPEEAGVTYTLSDTDTTIRTGYYASELNYLIGGSNHGPNYGTPAHCSVSSAGTATCTNVEFAG